MKNTAGGCCDSRSLLFTNDPSIDNCGVWWVAWELLNTYTSTTNQTNSPTTEGFFFILKSTVSAPKIAFLFR